MSEFTWTAPEGMDPKVAAAWRKFYHRAASGVVGYSATPEQYRLMYLAQMGRCFICQSAKGIHPDDPKGKGSQRLGWDHNHATGAVRGLLCTLGDKSCNRILGWFRNRPETFQRAASYLHHPPAMVLGEVERLAEYGHLHSSDDQVGVARALLWPDGVPGVLADKRESGWGALP